jgi:hypothetical protein
MPLGSRYLGAEMRPPRQGVGSPPSGNRPNSGRGWPKSIQKRQSRAQQALQLLHLMQLKITLLFLKFQMPQVVW